MTLDRMSSYYRIRVHGLPPSRRILPPVARYCLVTYVGESTYALSDHLGIKSLFIEMRRRLTGRRVERFEVQEIES